MLVRAEGQDELRVTYIGHATLLLTFGSTSVLTDPNFDDKLGYFLPRVSPPGVSIAELPRVDAILLTHAHADHLSFHSLRALPAETPLYAPPSIARWLLREGISNARSIESGQSIRLGDLTITVATARHIGARYVVDRWRGAAYMYLIDDGIHSVLFAGDTAVTPDAVSLAKTIEPRQVNVALLPIGFAPKWKNYFFRRGHLTAADALAMFEQIDARILIPFHWGTFRHVTSGAYDAINVLRSLLRTYPRSSDVKLLAPGESLELGSNDR